MPKYLDETFYRGKSVEELQELRKKTQDRLLSISFVLDEKTNDTLTAPAVE